MNESLVFYIVGLVVLIFGVVDVKVLCYLRQHHISLPKWIKNLMFVILACSSILILVGQIFLFPFVYHLGIWIMIYCIPPTMTIKGYSM